MRLCFLLLPFFLFVQAMLSQNPMALHDDFRGVFYNPAMYVQRYEIEDSSPYLNLKFEPAKIGDRDKTYLVRFNAYEGSVEVWIKENKVIELNSPGEERIKMLDGSDKEYLLTTYESPKGGREKGFLEELKVCEAYTLYKKETIKYFKKVKAEAYAKEKPARFEQSTPQFYIKLAGGDAPIKYLSNSKKKFLGAFDSQNATKAKTIIKKEKLSLTKSEDIIRILDSMYN